MRPAHLATGLVCSIAFCCQWVGYVPRLCDLSQEFGASGFDLDLPANAPQAADKAGFLSGVGQRYLLDPGATLT
jgi:hypothetical protein